MRGSEQSFIRENVPLAPLTTLGVGGPARYFVEATEEGRLGEALEWGSRRALPLFVLGGGSNVLVSDAGFNGLVIHVALRGIHPDPAAAGIVTVAAGEDWDDFVRWSVEHQLWGIECLSGIPGSVGATPVQNVGAYGQEVAAVIQSARVLERYGGNISELSRAECAFAYRSSIFNTTYRDHYIILSVAFLLDPGGGPRIEYPDLERIFPAGSPRPSLAEMRAAVISVRSAKAMVINPANPDSRSAGSFFKNPVLSEEAYLRAQAQARQNGILDDQAALPRRRDSFGMSKLPAAWLIEQAGFHKGFAIGRAAISSKHALALVNRGGATAQEILDLMVRIRDGVHSKFAVELEPEPVFVGF